MAKGAHKHKSAEHLQKSQCGPGGEDVLSNTSKSRLNCVHLYSSYRTPQGSQVVILCKFI